MIGAMSARSRLLQTARLHLAVCDYGQSPKQQTNKKPEAALAKPTSYPTQNAAQSQRLYVWGYAATGALGIPTFLKPTVGRNAIVRQDKPYRLKFIDEHSLKVSAVACGFGFTVYATQHNGELTLVGTGINTDSQIGCQKDDKVLDYLIQPAKINLPLPSPRHTSVLSVSCGRAHTVVVTNDGVYTLGNNATGQCGREIVQGEIYSGSMTVSKINLKGIKKAVCGQDHTIFLTDDGKLFSCGLGSDGQTGLGVYDCTSHPLPVKGDIEGEVIVDVASKGDTTLAVSDKGDVFGWGNSEYGQLASVSDSTQVNVSRRLPFSKTGRVTGVATGSTICGLQNDKGQVFVWGYGILGKGPKLEQSSLPEMIPETIFGKNEFTPTSKVTKLVCGLNHYAAVTDSGSLYTWGRNQSGCLGLGHRLDQFFPFMVAVPAEVKDVFCGADHTVALTRSFI